MKKLSDIAILVVEDEKELREILVIELKACGATVDSTENGRVAFDLTKEKMYDIVLSDVRMPDGDGAELLKKIYASPDPKPKVILHTGFSDISEEEAKLLGAFSVLYKPTRISKLVDEILSALQKI